MNLSPKVVLKIFAPLVLLAFLTLQSFFIVFQTEQALLLQFGELIKVHRSPGLGFKIPFVQEVLFYDNRILNFDVSAIEVTLGDQKRVVIDLFAHYRIADPVRFYKTVRNEAGAQSRLSTLITGIGRSVLGHASLPQLLSPERTRIISKIRKLIDQSMRILGVELVDVRITRAELPPANREAIFNRIISERQNEAQELRAEGEEKAEVIRAEAERERLVILANAEKEGQILIGEGEKRAAQFYREAYSQAPEFATFYLMLQANKQSLNPVNTKYVLSPKSDLLGVLKAMP